MYFDRETIRNRLHAQLTSNGHIIGVAAGAGISARYAVKGGADFILALNSGRFRQMGLSSLGGLLPFGNCNEMVMEFGSKEIVPLVREVPVLFGLCATDPTIQLEAYIQEIRDKGFSGINNYPTVGLIGGVYGEALQEEGIGFDAEVEAIRIASSMGMFTIAFVFNREQACQMADAGADVICAHLGFTKGGILGAAKVLSLKAAAELASDIFQACQDSNPHVFKMIYGGPVNTPTDVKYMYDNTGAVGYLGGSSFERIPSEAAITKTAIDFKEVGLTEQDKLLHKMLEGVTKHYDYVQFVKEYVETNYRNDISFAELAQVAHISRTHLSHLFKKEVGCTFPEYLTRFRINKAIELMKESELELSELSSLVGYNDYAHFSKTFKKKTGKSPREYQRQYKNT
ncbi:MULTISPECIES: phosphoenolpyruvate hydrolase family protein [Paenibacillus]|uniref:Helix-turn-helix domain-containing protein n=1 Tax=Paenibacillus alvei TaxID=44250 RepID=A0AAP6ZZW1_PAEAL|nr:phosphoenolpyruvate hydrolase family protein [Paenibacillus alvei]MCY7483092.1 phosphoenolpyruvate hydrolase family protein [Paenibacillus alvei]NOJ73008.1 helix-turn-helix domain-containing protein [Paenibacillus alvei]